MDSGLPYGAASASAASTSARRGLTGGVAKRHRQQQLTKKTPAKIVNARL